MRQGNFPLQPLDSIIYFTITLAKILRGFMLQLLQAFYNVNEIATMLGKTVASVQAHLARKNFEAVPPPIHLGRRLAWPVESTNVWIQQRTEEAQGQFLPTQVTSGKIGRPTKSETRSRRLKSGKE